MPVYMAVTRTAAQDPTRRGTRSILLGVFTKVPLFIVVSYSIDSRGEHIRPEQRRFLLAAVVLAILHSNPSFVPSNPSSKTPPSHPLSTSTPTSTPLSAFSLASALSSSSGVLVFNCNACIPPALSNSSFSNAYTIRCLAGCIFDSKAADVMTSRKWVSCDWELAMALWWGMGGGVVVDFKGGGGEGGC